MPNGILTKEEVRPNITFVSYEQETGEFTINKEPIGGVEGILLGFNTHVLTWKGQDYKKFDIYLQAPDGKVIQLQLGASTWIAYHLMNSLMSIDFKNPNGKLKIIAYQKDGSNRMYTTFNGEKLPWKYSAEDMKFPEDKDARNTKKDKACEKFIDALVSTLEYKQKPQESVEGNGEAAVVENDDLPF